MTETLIPHPLVRKLRIFAFDPSIASQHDLAEISEITISVPWENLEPGPVGEYLEVVDADPASNAFYHPVDLDEKYLLAQDGLAPSETNPQFHQQMVYAVAMATIEHFEHALGRVALWSSHREQPTDEQFVRRLRIYPHALRDRNAYYSPAKKALLFGYFPAGAKSSTSAPGTIVFTCLSHDIIAHETTHALLDGVHPRFNEPVNVDVHAFHEAFADIVALFQHFSYPGVLQDQVRRTRGNLAGENLLGQLAQQFGRASGRGKALRDALGKIDEQTGQWTPLKPDVRALEKEVQPHSRGAILVAAVFGAFLKVYRAHTGDLYRIASEGTGVLREGEIHPDLAARLSDEAARSARTVLQMCIRAIDYCPPVGITFGDYLSAIVTADHDLSEGDLAGYCLAFVESFQQWGIHPKGMRSMSVESLLWPDLTAAQEAARTQVDRGDMASLYFDETPLDEPEQQSAQKRYRRRSPSASARHFEPWNLDTKRDEVWAGMEVNAARLWWWLVKGKGQEFARTCGIVLDGDNPPPTVYRSASNNAVAVEVHSVRTALRRSRRGSTLTSLVIEITQGRRGYFGEDVQREMDAKDPIRSEVKHDFVYRAGCTLLLDPRNMGVQRVIRTPYTIAEDEGLKRQRDFLLGGGMQPPNAFYSAKATADSSEPFALLHRDDEE